MLVGNRPPIFPHPTLPAAPAPAAPVAPGTGTIRPMAQGVGTSGWLGRIGTSLGGLVARIWDGLKRLFGGSGPQTPATYTVQPGDTLSGIARKVLGDAERWREIHALNRDLIPNPHLIQPGMVLKLPAGEPSAGPRPSDPPSSGTPTDIARGLAIPAPGTNPSRAVLDTLLGRAADKYGIPRPILKAIALRESNWRQYDSSGNPVAGRNPTTTDWGLMQINDYWHPQAFPQAKTDVAFNVEYGAKYLASQYKRYGDWKDAVAAYNAGSVKKDASGRYSNQPYVDFVFAHLKQFA